MIIIAFSQHLQNNLQSMIFLFINFNSTRERFEYKYLTEIWNARRTVTTQQSDKFDKFEFNKFNNRQAIEIL